MNDFAFYGYGLAAVSFGVVSLLLLSGWRGRLQSVLFVFANLTTTLWATLAALHAGYGAVPLEWLWGSEVVRNVLWLLFLLQMLRPLAQGNLFYTRMLAYIRLAVVILAFSLLLLHADLAWMRGYLPALEIQREFSLIGQLLYAVLGMALVEQLFRNTPQEHRWGIKYLCFALGGIAVYDFYLYTDALLFHRLDLAIWSARGAVNAMAVPLLAVTVARNPKWSLPLVFSRRMVFHSTALFSAGLYMLLMAMAGYYIKIYGGQWGAVLQITFLFGAVLVLVALLFSGQLRARAKVFFNKHFFTSRFDYREEWLRLINLLAGQKTAKPLVERIIWALGEIVESPGGVLWLRGDNGVLRNVARFNYPSTLEVVCPPDDPFVAFLETQGWIVNLNEYRLTPDLYDGLELPDWLQDYPETWLIVPLLHDNRLIGFVLLMQPRAAQVLNWEGLDLLKTAGMQAAGYLALNQAAEALAEARQFEGFNRLSAFVIHDLKNLIAQLSLVAKNAVRHRHNPDFIDDAVQTIENSVAKMNRLLAQLKSADTLGQRRPVELTELLRQAVRAKANARPRPSFESAIGNLMVEADPDRLSSVIGHVIQNALDATPSTGRVAVRLRVEGDQAIVSVDDTGVGMDEEFLRTRLFRAFDSTKGLTGMGIGAYECREVIMALGGSVQVASTLGRGTVFRVLLPVLATTE